MNSEPKNQKDNTPLQGRPPGYRSYVLRFWQERSEELPHVVWRYSLEDPLTDQRYGFPDLDTLTAWLKSEMAKEQNPKSGE